MKEWLRVSHLDYLIGLYANPWPTVSNRELWDDLQLAAGTGLNWLEQRFSTLEEVAFGLVILNPCLERHQPAAEAVLATISLNGGNRYLLAAASKAEQHWRHGLPSGQLAHELLAIGEGFAGNGSTVYRRVIGAGHGAGRFNTDLTQQMLKTVMDRLHQRLQQQVLGQPDDERWLTARRQPGTTAIRMLDRPLLPL